MVDIDTLLSISPPTDPPEVPADPPAFRLVRRDAILRRLPVTSPLLPEIRGDIAEIAGKLVARWEAYEADGSITTCYNRLPSNADLDYVYRPGRILPVKPGQWTGSVEGESPDINLTLGTVTTNASREIEGRADQTHLPRWHAVDMSDPRDEEQARFIREFPAMAERFGVSAPLPPERVFEPGRVRVEPIRPAIIGLDIDWRMFVELHSEGQWGLHGVYLADFEPTAAQRFAAGLQPVNVQNHLALATRSGPIRSRWLLSDEQQALIPPVAHLNMPRLGFVEVLTALSPHRPAETIAWLTLETAG